MPERSEAKAISPVPPPTGVGPRAVGRAFVEEVIGTTTVPLITMLIRVGVGVNVDVGSDVEVIVSVGIDVGVEVSVTRVNGKAPRILAGKRLVYRKAELSKMQIKTAKSDHDQTTRASRRFLLSGTKGLSSSLEGGGTGPASSLDLRFSRSFTELSAGASGISGAGTIVYWPVDCSVLDLEPSKAFWKSSAV